MIWLEDRLVLGASLLCPLFFVSQVDLTNVNPPHQHSIAYIGQIGFRSFPLKGAEHHNHNQPNLNFGSLLNGACTKISVSAAAPLIISLDLLPCPVRYSYAWLILSNWHQLAIFVWLETPFKVQNECQ